MPALPNALPVALLWRRPGALCSLAAMTSWLSRLPPVVQAGLWMFVAGVTGGLMNVVIRFSVTARISPATGPEAPGKNTWLFAGMIQSNPLPTKASSPPGTTTRGSSGCTAPSGASG